jgi:hypothetical protein
VWVHDEKAGLIKPNWPLVHYYILYIWSGKICKSLLSKEFILQSFFFPELWFFVNFSNKTQILCSLLTNLHRWSGSTLFARDGHRQNLTDSDTYPILFNRFRFTPIPIPITIVQLYTKKLKRVLDWLSSNYYY